MFRNVENNRSIGERQQVRQRRCVEKDEGKFEWLLWRSKKVTVIFELRYRRGRMIARSLLIMNHKVSWRFSSTASDLIFCFIQDEIQNMFCQVNSHRKWVIVYDVKFVPAIVKSEAVPGATDGNSLWHASLHSTEPGCLLLDLNFHYHSQILASATYTGLK